MEAKDIVAIVAKEVARQAEFGYEPSGEDFVISGWEAGRREVVEWIMANSTEGNCCRTFNTDRYWQEKLKEWGIDAS